MPDFLPYTQGHLPAALQMIGSAVYREIATLDIRAWRTKEPTPFAERTTGEELNLQLGDAWGKLFDCAWFHFTGQVPQEAAGKTVVLLLDVNGEMLVVDAAGQPLRGLTNKSSEYDYSLGRPGKRVLPIAATVAGGEIIDVWADAGCNDLFGRVRNGGVIEEAAIAICDEETLGLYYDFEVLLDLLNVLPAESPRYRQVQLALNDAAWQLSGGFSPANVEAARLRLHPVLAKHGDDPSLRISAIGHAHMDLGWLWPVRETKRKGARTFATALANMERYPDYHFGASQPQLFQWMKEDYPGLYERIKQRVAEGRLEPQGVMWVEADTNVPSGEALVRQVLYGTRFFQKEFGITPRYLWLPDVFGYSAALPQILKKGGADYFMTQKMSWNQVNTFPHHSFFWQGLDGSQVLSHMLPEETYNSPAAPRAVAKIEKNYKDAGVSEHSLMLYGIGDGGGGPGEEHLERLARIRDLAGLSPVRQEPAACFFEEWQKQADRFPTWVGELYLERHSGTLTTEAKNKWFNRHIEQSLREWEWMAVLTGVLYPSERLETIWREVLLYQFHDILPGSSIKRVYDESLARYAVLMQEVEARICDLQAELARQVDTTGMRAPLVAFNSLSWQRQVWLEHQGQWKQVLLPASGYTTVDFASGDPLPALTAQPELLENDLLRVTFNPDGSIRSLFDKTLQREAVPAGQSANRLVVYYDPGDAWDFPLDYANQIPQPMQLVSSEARVEGPRAVLEQKYVFGHSELRQQIVLEAGSRQVAFHSRLRWFETRTMLRTSFPVAVHAEEASFEIQFGHLRRATHRNTTWELARDEVAAHKWVDLSQRDFGVALLNDSKYGHKVKDNIIDLNLLRSVPYPGQNDALGLAVAPGEPHPGYTDQGEHVFSYALYPHPGDLVSGGVIQAGYEFNYPPRIIATEAHPGARPLETCWLTVENAPSVIIEAVKKAEDDDSIIVRLYESSHASTQAALRFNLPVVAAYETNLVEQVQQPLVLVDQQVSLSFEPFEIKTIKLMPR